MVSELEVTYCPEDSNLWNSIKENTKLKILNIFVKKTLTTNFLEEFYTALDSIISTSNLFLVVISGMSCTLDAEKLQKLEKLFIIQCVSESGNKVYIKESLNKKFVVIDMNADEEQMDESAIYNVSKEDFGFSIIVKALKCELVGEFTDYPYKLRRIKFDAEKEFDNYKLIDYVALHDDFLSACFLSSHIWDLRTRNGNNERTLEIAAEKSTKGTLKCLLDSIKLDSKEEPLLSLVNDAGDTPLLIAVKKNVAENVRLFIEHGADVKYINQLTKKESAVDFAREKKCC